MSKLRVNTLETLDGSYAVNVADLSLATTVVEDNLTSTNVASALSANQGRVLKGLVDGNVTGVSSSTAQQLAVASGTTGKGIKFVPVQIDDSGNMTVVGTGLRFKADFSNATVANRFMFQSSTANGYTVLRAIPNGTSQYAELSAGNASDTSTAYQTALLSVSATEVRLSSSVANGATYLPLTTYTGGSQSLNVATDGTFTSVRGAIGYGPGAGGTGTVAAGNVTINKPSGIVIYSGLTLNAGATVVFDITSTYANGDCVGVATMAKGTASYWEYECNCIASGAGSMTVMLRNISAANKTGVTVHVNFAIFKHSQS